MNKLKILLSTLFVSCLPFICSAGGKIYVFTLSRNKTDEKDLADNPNGGTWIVGDRAVLDVIKLVNSYLWFAVGFVCFLFMVINGYKLITAQGDEKQTKSATKALLGSFLGIVICILSYIIVNLTVKLFM